MKLLDARNKAREELGIRQGGGRLKPHDEKAVAEKAAEIMKRVRLRCPRIPVLEGLL